MYLHSVGVAYLVLARGLVNSEPIEMLKYAWPRTPITVVQLLATPPIIRKRLIHRDSGDTLREHLEEVDTITKLIDTANIVQSKVVKENRPIEDVAAEVIGIAGWNSR